jgi:hypothetical protein
MSANKYQPHLLILPEDDANRELANGFILNQAINPRVVQIMPPARGWTKVLRKFRDDYLEGMRTKYQNRHILFLIDFDRNEERLHYVQKEIPQDVADRVFVLGTWSEPEELKTKTKKSLEHIGKTLANDCPGTRNELWSDELLRHNELERIISSVGSFLFE